MKFKLFVGKTVQVHNGKDYTKIIIVKEMIGHKLGEFVKTRKTFKYKKFLEETPTEVTVTGI